MRGWLTETRLLSTSTTALSPGADRTRSRSPSSTMPNNLPVSCTSNVISEAKVNAVPSAGLMAVAEKRESGLVGTLVAWPLVISD